MKARQYPLHLARYPISASREKLAGLFRLENRPEMQDWEVEVADPNRITEFLNAYEASDLSDDDRFLLMSLIIASFDDAGESDGEKPFSGKEWEKTRKLLIRDCKLHASTLWYWSSWGTAVEDAAFTVTRHIRPIWLMVEEEYSAMRSGVA